MVRRRHRRRRSSLPASDTLSVSAPTTAVAGASFSVTVTARTAGGAVDPNYAGTVTLTGTDGQAVLPSSYTFTTGAGADDGSHTFTVTLKTAGTQTLTANSATTGSVTTGGIAVSPAAASQLVLSGLASTATAGAAGSLTVTAKDAYGNVATGYTGTVVIASTDGAAILPAAYGFTKNDAGKHIFSLTFLTAGTQSVTASDVLDGLSATLAGIGVSPAAPIGLSASAASSSAINLTWTGSGGRHAATRSSGAPTARPAGRRSGRPRPARRRTRTPG